MTKTKTGKSLTLRIAIDGNEANVAQRVGSNVYAFEILTALEKITRKSPVEVTVLLAAAAHNDLPKSREGWRYKIVKPSFLWTQIAAPIHLFWYQSRYDVFFTPGHYAPRLVGVPYVSSVMDLAFLKYPEQFKKKDYVQLRDWTKYSVKKAEKVVAISEATKADVVKHYGRTPEDVVVAYPALNSESKALSKTEAATILKKLGVTSPYILYVGTLQPRKNLVRLISAFERIQRLLSSQQRPERVRSKFKLKPVKELDKVQLVLAGKLGWLTEEVVAKAQNSSASADIILTGYVDEKTKAALYQGAHVSTLIGLYEGFGIPPLESFSYGTIPVVSQTTSLPEVVGEGGILVNPENEASIADGLLTGLLLTAQERAKLRRQGRKQLQKFSWTESAQIILDTLRQVGQRA